MQAERYILTKNVRTPVVINTPYPHKPTAIKYKEFREGETIKGVVQKGRDGKPRFIIVKGMYVIPAHAVRLLVTKNIGEPNSNASGKDAGEKLEQYAKGGNPRVKYMDAALVGALVGVTAVFFAQKKGWLTPPSKSNLVYGALGAAGLSMYVIFRIRNRNKPR